MSPMLSTINRIERRRALVASAKYLLQSVAVCACIVLLFSAVNHLWG